MTKNELTNLYFDWMYHLVFEDRTYWKLMCHLHSINFRYIISMDGNRAEDGTTLRYRFGRENSYDDRMIAEFLDDRPCSVLEMMIALAIRCEEHIMDDPDIGNRVGEWFENMIVNLGLENMVDSNYNRKKVDDIIEKFLNAEYRRNGKGGLFKTNSGRDMRSVEIWYQMCLYLEENK